MRRALRRKAMIIVAAIISSTAIPAVGIVATAAPALAAATICNSFGNQYCAGDPNTVNNGDPVVLTLDGRQIDEVAQHFTCCGGHEVYRLHFAAAPTQCIGVAASLNVTVRDCSGGNSNNTNWAKEPQSNGTIRWFSNTVNGYLASDNRLGHQLFVTTLCTNCGIYFAWTN